MNSLVIGELNIDLIVNGLDEFPALGREILCEDISRVLGSSSAIFAVKLSALGGKVNFSGIVGDDDNGQFVLNELKNALVGCDHVITSPDIKTGVGISLSFPQEKALVTFPGSINKLTLAALDLSLLSHYGHLHCASYYLQTGLQESFETIFRESKKLGLAISFDPGWDPGNQWNNQFLDLLPYIDLFLPNESEAMAITRTNSPEKALDKLSSLTGSCVVIKRGAKGALAIDSRGNQYTVDAYPADVLDTTGAGDSFNAGLVYALLYKNEPFPDALLFASASGAISTMTVGGAAFPPTETEVKNYMARFEITSRLL